MLHEVARVRRHAAPGEVRRRAYDGEPEVTGHGDGDHVLVDHLAELAGASGSTPYRLSL